MELKGEKTHVVISKGTLARMIELKIRIQGQFVTNLRGDGLIVSTPTGSTAYSLSAGGPIINPAVEGLILTPVCPHTLTHRPLIVPLNAEIDVEIMAAEHRTRLIRFPESSYYDVLREKLKWGDG